MEKTNTWRRILLGASAMLLCGTLTFAVTEIVPAKADESVLTSTDVNDIVAEGSKEAVKVENDQTKPWKFSEEYSEDGNIAWAAGNSGYIGTDGPNSTVSSLKFTASQEPSTFEQGILAFDFYFAGISSSGMFYSMVGYQFNTPLSAPKTFDASTFTPGENKFTDSEAKTIARGQCESVTLGQETTSEYGESEIVDTGVVTSLATVDGFGSGWFHAKIVVPSGTSSVYVAYGKEWDHSGYSEEHSVLAIRNVMYLQGEKHVSFGIADDTEGNNGTIEAKVGQDSVESGQEVKAGSNLVLTAQPKEGNKFYAWVDSKTHNILSYDKSITISVIEDVSVEAVIGDFAVRVGGKYYTSGNVSQAFSAAGNGDDKDVIVVDSVTLEGTIAVPQGVNFILPFNVGGDYYAKGTTTTAQSRVSWASDDVRYKDPVYTLTISGDLTVNGNFYVGGVIHYPDQSAQAHTSGAYSELAVNGTVTVENGGVMDVYGRVTGTGGITVKGGGKIYEPFLILDFAGGQNTQDLYYKNQTPFNRYAVINVQCQKGLTIEYQGELIGHASLNVSTMGGVHTLDAAIISYAEATEGDEDPKGFITLTKGGSLTAIYHDEDHNGHKKIPDAQDLNNTVDIGYTELIFTGGAIANSLKISYSPVNIDTENVVGFSIPYNFQITLKSGQYKLNSNFKLMPGAGLTVEKGATLTAAKGKNFFIYDGLVQSKMSGKSYPTAAELTAAGYSTSANFIVNGAFVFTGGTKEEVSAKDGEVISTLLGVIQTKDTTGKAKIEIGEHVTLSGKIVDGGTTKYDCNYSEYQSSARVWDKVHKELAELEAGKTYVSTYAVGDTFNLPQATVSYDKGNWGTAASLGHSETGHKGHGEEGNSNWVTDAKTQAVEDLKGAWMVEHGETHTFDWEPTDDEKGADFFENANCKTATRTCQELGCNAQETKTLYKNVGQFVSKEYKGATYTVEELFEELFGTSDAIASSTIDSNKTLKDAGSYSITVTLNTENGYFVKDGEFVSSLTFTFEIEKKEITVEILDQEATYSGSEPTVSQEQGAGYTVEGLYGTDKIGIEISKEEGKNAGTYDLTAEAVEGLQYANKNYAITFEYTNKEEQHSTFKIKKATLTVTPNNVTSPQGEEPIPTTDFEATITGYVNGEEGLLTKDDIKFTCAVTKESQKGTYEIVPSTEKTLDNYEIELKNGTYTVTDPVFAGVKFAGDTVTYDGAEHKIEVSLPENLHNSAQVTYDIANTQTNAGTYVITATVTYAEYTQQFKATLIINKLDVTVELLEQSKLYDGAEPDVSSERGTGWKFTTDGFELCGSDTDDDLGIALTAQAPTKNAGKYAIHATFESENYNVIFDNNDAQLYTIEKVAITVKINDVTVKYGENVEEHKNAEGYDKTPAGLVEGEELVITLNFDAVQNKAGSYAITGTAPDTGANINYVITFEGSYESDDEFNGKAGTFTIEKRAVTVVIEDQSETYNYQHNYNFYGTMWNVSDEEGEGLAEGEGKADLNVTLTVEPTLTDAGTYAITGTWDNGNYEVTFKGSYEGGEAGTFTVNKQDVSDRAEFAIWEGFNASLEGDHLTLKFAGEPLVLEGSVSITEGNTPKELHFTIDPPKLDEIREYTVTVTIDDTNYSGSHTFTVTVTNAEGYTKNLSDALKTLGELAEGLDIDALKAEDYGTLVRMYETIEDLTDEEREIGAKALAPYQAFVDKWNGLAEIGDVIETAESIANAPIEGLFAAAAALTALSALAYIVTKGGIL